MPSQTKGSLSCVHPTSGPNGFVSSHVLGTQCLLVPVVQTGSVSTANRLVSVLNVGSSRQDVLARESSTNPVHLTGLGFVVVVHVVAVRLVHLLGPVETLLHAALLELATLECPARECPTLRPALLEAALLALNASALLGDHLVAAGAAHHAAAHACARSRGAVVISAGGPAHTAHPAGVVVARLVVVPPSQLAGNAADAGAGGSSSCGAHPRAASHAAALHISAHTAHVLHHIAGALVS
mmetsp:Transcript_17190/g.51396  ORF Transcript_17190/g.51396 Transcript_17190/m.51396 type:complete len:240 (+) Transcript_17190:2401-3120(+)